MTAILPTGWQCWLTALLLVSFGSFAWGMQKFFTRPAGVTPGMKMLAGCGVLFGILHLTALLATRISSLRGVSAACLFGASLALYWWAIRTNFRRPISASFSPDAPEHLVQDGPYRLIRHPLYCAYLLTWLATPVATARLPLLVTFALMLAIYLAAARAEESKFLQGRLGGEYQQYRSRTGLLLPNVTKLGVGWFSRNAGDERFQAKTL
jgi:protein-S-isoprenylcysteine O-methyltransferase Ste14